MPQPKRTASAWRPGQTSSRSGSAFIIEVLVVIAILGIMAATAAYSMNSILQRGEGRADQRNAMRSSHVQRAPRQGIAPPRRPDCAGRPIASRSRDPDQAPSRHLTCWPPFQTCSMPAPRPSRSYGSPPTTIRSASFPSSTVPSRSSTPRSRAASRVARAEDGRGSHAGHAHECQLPQVVAVRADTGISAHRDLHTSRHHTRGPSQRAGPRPHAPCERMRR